MRRVAELFNLLFGWLGIRIETSVPIDERFRQAQRMRKETMLEAIGNAGDVGAVADLMEQEVQRLQEEHESALSTARSYAQVGNETAARKMANTVAMIEQQLTEARAMLESARGNEEVAATFAETLQASHEAQTREERMAVGRDRMAALTEKMTRAQESSLGLHDHAGEGLRQRAMDQVSQREAKAAGRSRVVGRLLKDKVGAMDAGTGATKRGQEILDQIMGETGRSRPAQAGQDAAATRRLGDEDQQK